MRADIVPGGLFPDYELPDHTGTLRTLSDLQSRDPMILTLARGHYCPKEHQQHRELAAHYPKIAVAYTQVVTISTDDHHILQELRGSVGAQWTFLSDPGRIIQQDLDIAEYTDPGHNPMIPHTLVLKPGLVVHSIYNGYWFWSRPSFCDLWHDLRAVTAQIRPDWDLSTPGLHEARLLHAALGWELFKKFLTVHHRSEGDALRNRLVAIPYPPDGTRFPWTAAGAWTVFAAWALLATVVAVAVANGRDQ